MACAFTRHPPGLRPPDDLYVSANPLENIPETSTPAARTSRTNGRHRRFNADRGRFIPATGDPSRTE
jgi:hypothetical protein